MRIQETEKDIDYLPIYGIIQVNVGKIKINTYIYLKEVRKDVAII